MRYEVRILQSLYIQTVMDAIKIVELDFHTLSFP